MGLGTVITLDFNFTGESVGDLPQIIKIDPIEAPGSLFLLDMKHPLAGTSNDAPTQGAIYGNMFAAQASPLLGTADTGAVAHLRYTLPTHGKVERTAKGGIHVIQSTTQTGYEHGFQLRLPSAVVRYFQTNPEHQFYVSQWGKTTRAEVAAQHSVAAISGTLPSSFAFTLGDGVTPGGGPTILGHRSVQEVAGVPNFRNAGVTKFHADFRDATILEQNAAIFEVGNSLVPNRGGTGKAGNHGAQVFYRGYIEDLTVSGRTYAEVDAIDFAEYTKHVLSPGGRYYGDTVPTDPATLP